MKPTHPTQERPKQDVSFEIVSDLVNAIRTQFCPDMPQKEWYQDNFNFIRRQVVMWPAAFIYGKGFTLPPERFKEILFGIFNTVKTNGDTGNVTYWPAYLSKCVQSHFKIHWEEYYNEAKAIRNKVDSVFFAVSRAQEAARGADPVEAIAMAQRAMTTAHRKKAVVKSPDQLSLF